MTRRRARFLSLPPDRIGAKRRRLLAGAALGAVLGLAATGEARAQAVNATPSVSAGSGSATFSRSGPPTPGVESVTVNTNSVIVNWVPNPPLPDPYIFLPAGNTITFQNGPGIGDFAVLNRILTNQTSHFNGNVVSQIRDLVAGTTRSGGTVLFSSPGGIVVGGTARFDVGSLVLTSLDVLETSPGNFIQPGGGFSFANGDKQPNAAITILPGAEINAPSEGSYIALVAPRVIQGGTVSVNGSAAYIAAEAVDIRVDQGLFDIIVNVGTDNAIPIAHTGSTGGPEQSGVPGDSHGIYAVTVGKNQAVRMLLEGTVGYDAAVAAGLENGVVVLSAGHNVFAGNIDPTPVPGTPASIEISNGTFTSEVNGRAIASITATATAAEPLAFNDTLRLTAGGAISLVADPGVDVTVGEDMILNGATIDIDNVTVGDLMSTNSAGQTVIDNATSVGSMLIAAGGDADLGILNAGQNLRVTAVNIDVDDGTAGEDLTLGATGDVTVIAARAGDDFRATAGGAFTGGTIDANGLGSDAEDVGTANEGSNIFIDADGDLRLDNAAVATNIELTSVNGSVLSSGLLDAGGNFEATAAVDVDLADVNAVGTIDLSALDDIDAATLDAGGTITTNAVGDVILTRATSTGGSINIFADGIVGIGRLDAFDDILVDPVSVDIAVLVAGGDITLDATTFINVGSADAGDDFVATAGTTFNGTTVIARGLQDSELGSGGPLLGGNIFVTAGDNLRLDNGDAADDIQLTSRLASIFSSTLLDAGSDIRATAALGDIDLTDAVAGASIDLDAGGFVDAASLTTTTGPINSDSGGATTIAAANSGGSTFIVAGGAAGLGTLQAGGSLFVGALGITLASGTAANDIVLDSGADILVTSAQVGDDFGANAVGAFTGGTVTTAGAGADNEAGSGTFGGSAIVVDSSGDLRLDNGTSPTRIQLTSTVGSILSAGTLRSGVLGANAAFGLALNDVFVVSNLNLTTTNGDISGNRFESDGAIVLTSSDQVTLALADSVGSTSVVAGGLADLGTFTSGVDINVNANAIQFDGATAARDVSLDAVANLNVTAARAGDDFFADAGGTFTGGTIIITGAGADSEAGVGSLAGRNIVIDSVGNLRLDTGTNSAGLIDLDSAGGSVLSRGTLTANRLLADAALDIALNNVSVVAPLALTTTNGSISGNSFTSNGNITLSASSGITLAAANSGGLFQAGANGSANLGAVTAATDINVTAAQVNLTSGNAGRNITLGSTGTVTVGTANAAERFIAVSAGNGTFTNLSAGISVAILSSGGSARFNGAVAAPTIVINSNDIDVAVGATIGNAATQTVSLTARPNGLQTVLGGSTQGPGYTLADAEADRINAVTLSVQSFANGTGANRIPDLLVRDLSLSGQRVGTLQIVTPGILQVEGGLILSGVRAGGGIEITATERLQLVTPTGSVRVRDAAGLTDGNLLLTSNNIWSASQSLLDQLRADSNFAGRDEALLANSGPVEPRGYIEAGDVVLAARDSLFVQNSGTLLTFAGITVRENTLRIVPTGTLPLRVFAFGRRINPDGSFVTNNAFFNEVQYQGRGGAVGYTDDAQFNLCFINTGVCRLPTPNNPLPGGPDIIEEPVGSGFAIVLPGSGDDLVDTSFADEPLIEEPVTSGGDSILWDCDNDDDGDCDEDDYDG